MEPRITHEIVMLSIVQTHPDSYWEKINMVIPPACWQTGMTTKKQ